MFAKAQWFQKRKYGGWGLSPKTWQGWVYVIGFVAVMVAIQSFGFISEEVKKIVSGLIIGLFILDILRIMFQLKKDELEIQFEAIAERNASWVMVVVLTVGIIYQVVISTTNDIYAVDPFLIATLIAGVLAKGLSYLILEIK